MWNEGPLGLTPAELRDAAHDIAAAFGITDFNPTKSWYRGYCKRHDVRGIRAKRKEIARMQVETVDHARALAHMFEETMSMLRISLTDKASRNRIYNMDESPFPDRLDKDSEVVSAWTNENSTLT